MKQWKALDLARLLGCLVPLDRMPWLLMIKVMMTTDHRPQIRKAYIHAIFVLKTEDLLKTTQLLVSCFHFKAIRHHDVRSRGSEARRATGGRTFQCCGHTSIASRLVQRWMPQIEMLDALKCRGVKHVKLLAKSQHMGKILEFLWIFLLDISSRKM